MNKRLQIALAAGLLAVGAAGGYAVGRCRGGAAQLCPMPSHGGKASLPPGHPDISPALAPALDEARLAAGKAADCPYLAGAGGGDKAGKDGDYSIEQWFSQNQSRKGGGHGPRAKD